MPSSLELKISFSQILFSLLSVGGALVLILGGFLMRMWNAPRGFDAISLVVTVLLGAAIAWWIYGGARRMWQETGLYLCADERQIVVATRQGRRTLQWSEIYDFTTEGRSVGGERGYWLSLRGRDDEVLAQWDRNWCRFTPGQIRRGDEIEIFVRDKLRALGRLEGEGNAASRAWESSHPLGQVKALEVRTNYGWIGWASIAFCLPCAVLSWNHPTGGPGVASVFLLFAALGVYLISAQAALRVDENQIEAESLFGLSRIQWQDVTRVGIDEQGTTLTFEGNDKRLSFSGPSGWKGPNKRELLLLLAAQCERRSIPFDTRARPGYSGSKNVKVRRTT